MKTEKKKQLLFAELRYLWEASKKLRTVTFAVIVVIVVLATSTPGHCTNVTFVVVADPQFNNDNEDWVAEANERVVDAINNIHKLNWPSICKGNNDVPTTCGGASQPIDEPSGVIIVGDLTWSRSYTGDKWCCRAHPWLSCSEWEVEPCGFTAFKDTYEERLNYPVYVGLGNHDLCEYWGWADLCAGKDNAYSACRESIFNYVTSVSPAQRFDEYSHAYSWDWGQLHLVQLHVGGDVYDSDGNIYSPPSPFSWLEADLDSHANEIWDEHPYLKKPVILFQHYNVDSIQQNIEVFDKRPFLGN
jgi:cytolysin (calcineurin-like family phosphatase)